MEPRQEEQKSERLAALSHASEWSILTVDYEDWFHILQADFGDPDRWDHLPIHAEEQTLRLLDLFDRYGARATFFVVGWLAERTPHILREIRRRGHSLGTHGYQHRCPNTMTEDDFRDDLLLSVAIIEKHTGIRVIGYRAPGFGIRSCSFSYLEVLMDCGFEYDSSVFPGLFPGRSQTAPMRPHHPALGDTRFWEIPVSAVRVLGVSVAFSGGGFLRALPGWFVNWAAKKVSAEGVPVVYYVHPRDVYLDAPTVRAGFLRNLRYYGGRTGMQAKLEGLLSNRRMTSIEHFIEHNRE